MLSRSGKKSSNKRLPAKTSDPPPQKKKEPTENPSKISPPSGATSLYQA